MNVKWLNIFAGLRAHGYYCVKHYQFIKHVMLYKESGSMHPRKTLKNMKNRCAELEFGAISGSS